MDSQTEWICKTRLRQAQDYKTFFMLNSTEHEISTAHKTKIPTNEEIYCFKSLRCCIFVMLINVKMPTIVGILTFMSRINFVLS